jgi:hypothetical protein
MVTWRTVIGTHLKVGEARGCHAYHDHDRDHATGTSASCNRALTPNLARKGDTVILAHLLASRHHSLGRSA